MTDNPTPSLFALSCRFGKIGVLSFGGPAGQIALMHKVIVDEEKWLDERHYLKALSFCMLLPGPEAMQLATYAGWRLRGVQGGLIAGLLFILPGATVVMALATLYALFGALPITGALFLGVKAAIVVIVLDALIKLARRALKRRDDWVIALLAFLSLFMFNLPFPLILIAAACYGAARASAASTARGTAPMKAVTSKQPIKVGALCLVLWLAPLGILWTVLPDHLLTDIGLFFTKLALVTFGGAYAVLAYMAQDIVQSYGWLSAGEMMDSLGLAETTPGPLILVTQFVGFLTAYKQGGLELALIAAFLTLWVTFLPCFLWIFALAPYVEWLGDQPRLSSALSAITAAVVGVISNLTLWFSFNLFFSRLERVTFGPLTPWVPEISSLIWQAVALTSISALMLLGKRWSILSVLGVMVLCGLGLWFTGLSP